MRRSGERKPSMPQYDRTPVKELVKGQTVVVTVRALGRPRRACVKGTSRPVSLALVDRLVDTGGLRLTFTGYWTAEYLRA
jgi:hypothetical protein